MNDNQLTFEELDIVPVNPLHSKCTIKVCYVSDNPNRNGSIITKEAMQEIANTLPGSPIVGYYNEQKEDFEGHNEIIEIDKHNGEVKFKVLTFPYGFVPPDAKVWYQDFQEDGEIRKYLCTEGLIWTGVFPESQKVFENSTGKGQSMEFDEPSMESLYNMRNGCMIINKAIFSKLCILGDDVEPCFEGARIIPNFSLDKDFQERINSMMNLFSLYKTEDNKPKMDELEKLTKELSDTNAKFEQLTKNYEELKASFDEKTKVATDFEVLTKDYETLKSKYDELTTSFSALEEESKQLKEFKVQTELKEKENMINSFSMLSDEDKKEVKEKINEYSLEEIESKLAVVCFRKKVPFNTEEEAQEEKEKTVPIAYSLNDPTKSNSDNAPDWIKAVRQKEQELFN